MAKRCVCHEHRPACDCEDNPEQAFLTRAAQIAGAVMLVPVAALGVLFLAAMLGSAIDIVADYQVDRDRCLNRATNGLEIEQCR